MSNNRDRSDDNFSEKGIIVGEFETKTKIVISLLNKDASVLTEFDLKTVKGMPIEELMPSMIAANHQ